MAREQSDREDLLREATALVRRAELRLPNEPEPVVIGFRRNGCLSIYFGADPVVQFNTAGELRRLFANGELLKAQNNVLYALSRVSAATETSLIRRELEPESQLILLADIGKRIDYLQMSLIHQNFTLVGQVPDDANVPGEVMQWLKLNPAPWKIAAAPNAS